MLNATFTPSTELLEYTVSIDRKAIWQLDLHLTMQSVPITTKVLSLISAFGDVFFIQLYGIGSVNNLWKVGDFLKEFLFPSTDITDRYLNYF